MVDANEQTAGGVGELLPILPAWGMPGMPGQSAAPSIRAAPKPDYLAYNPRGWHERMVYNTGITYLGGLARQGRVTADEGMRPE